MSAVLYADMDKVREVGKAYVENGHPAFRAERQRDVDGALVFLQSDAAAKLRPPGLQPKDVPLPERQHTALELLGGLRRG